MNETQFKVGSVYRNMIGAACRVVSISDGAMNLKTCVSGYDIGGGWDVATGKLPGSPTLDLIPGELSFVDGSWVSAPLVAGEGEGLGILKQKPHGARLGDLVHLGGREYVRTGTGFEWYRDMDENEEVRFFAGNAEIADLVWAAERAHVLGSAQSSNAAMISRDGVAAVSTPAPVVTQQSKAHKAVAGLLLTSDSLTSNRGHQVLPRFGSADLIR